MESRAKPDPDHTKLPDTSSSKRLHRMGADRLSWTVSGMIASKAVVNHGHPSRSGALVLLNLAGGQILEDLDCLKADGRLCELLEEIEQGGLHPAHRHHQKGR